MNFSRNEEKSIILLIHSTSATKLSGIYEMGGEMSAEMGAGERRRSCIETLKRKEEWRWRKESYGGKPREQRGGHVEPAGCPDDAFEAALLLHSLRLTLTFSLSLHVPKTAQHRFIPPGMRSVAWLRLHSGFCCWHLLSMAFSPLVAAQRVNACCAASGNSVCFAVLSFGFGFLSQP